MKRILTAAFAACLMALLFTSCSKKAAPTDSIPDNIVFACTFDMEDILENAGCHVGDDGIELSSKLSGLCNNFMAPSQARMFKKVLAIKGIDYEHITCFVTMGSSASAAPMTYCTVALDDEGDFVKSIEDDLNMKLADRDNGFKVFVGTDDQVMIKDGYLWITTGQRGYKDVVDVIADAKDKPLVAWKADILGGDNTLNMLVDPTAISPVLRAQIARELGGSQQTKAILDNTYAIQGNLKGLNLTASCTLFNKEGKNIGLDEAGLPNTLQNIDTSLLKYFTSNDVILMAMGISGDVDWSSIFSSYMNSLGAYEVEAMQPYMQQVAQVLSYIDGTVMLGGGVKTDNLMELMDVENNFDVVDVALAVQLKAGNTDQVMAQLDEQVGALVTPDVKAAGIDYVTTPSGRIFKTPQGNIYFSTNDRVLYIGLHPTKDGGTCPVKAPQLTDKYMALVIDIAKTSPLARCFGLPFGIKGSISGNAQGSELNVQLTDCQGKNFLEEILNSAI